MSSRNEEQNALKAGHSALAGGPGGPTANVHAETKAPELSGNGGRSPLHSRRADVDDVDAECGVDLNSFR